MQPPLDQGYFVGMHEFLEAYAMKIAAMSLAMIVAFSTWAGSQLFENGKVDARQTQRLDHVAQQLQIIAEVLDDVERTTSSMAVDVGVIKDRTMRLNADEGSNDGS